MNKKFLVCAIVFASLSLASCKKHNGGNDTTTPVEPIKTAKGTVNGPAASKQIGSSGGELVSADGYVKIIVPAGAVSGNTAFTIQPITNTASENDPAHKAYRLLPEGHNFAKPVKVIFEYTANDLNGTSEDLLTALYQSDDGSWLRVPASLNKNANTIEISTMHFSDWQVRGAIEIWGKDALAPGESSMMHLFGMYDNDDVTGVLTPLTSSGWDGQILSTDGWRIVSGPGSLSAVANDPGPVFYQKKYTAPASVTTAQKAEIAVTVSGNIIIPDSSAPNGKRAFQQITLLKEILIYPASFMAGTFGSKDLTFSNVVYTSGQGFAISARNGQEEISISIDANPGKGSFPSGDFIVSDGNSKTSYSFPDVTTGVSVYFSEYVVCSPVQEVRYHGVVRIDEFGAIGQPIKGSFEGTLYRLVPGPGSCPQYDAVPLSIRFGCIRTM